MTSFKPVMTTHFSRVSVGHNGVLGCNVRGHLGDNIHEDGLVHADLKLVRSWVHPDTALKSESGVGAP